MLEALRLSDIEPALNPDGTLWQKRRSGLTPIASMDEDAAYET
jgi:hypothetical protein